MSGSVELVDMKKMGGRRTQRLHGRRSDGCRFDSPRLVKQREELKSTQVSSFGDSVRRRLGPREWRSEFTADTRTLLDIHTEMSRSKGSGSLP